jgi:osmotically-inducible protein OsmY
MNSYKLSATTIFSRFFILLALVFAVGCASTDKQASTGEYIDDTVITTRVKAAIFADDELKTLEINVETFKSVVQLSGFVSEASHIPRAERVARGVKGVESVKNDLRVK